MRCDALRGRKSKTAGEGDQKRLNYIQSWAIKKVVVVVHYVSYEGINVSRERMEKEADRSKESEGIEREETRPYIRQH